MSVYANTKIDDSFYPQCYKNYSKVSKNTFEVDATYKIQSEKSIDKIVQNNQFVPFQKIQDAS